MKVLVTGATGFTGGHVVPLLLERGIQVRVFARPSSDRRSPHAHAIEWVVGDLGDAASLQRALDGADALINIASLGFGHAPTIVQAARASRVSRAIFISTTAIFTTLNAPSKAVRTEAERIIGESGLAYTILRPTMIYGGPGDRNMAKLIRYLRRWPLLPIVGDGQSLQQPVYVEDVAAAILGALMAPITPGRAYNLSGAAPLTYDEVVATVCRLLGRRRWIVHLPARPVAAGLRLAERASLRLPIKAEQISRLNESKAFSHDAATRDFGYRPRSFAEGIALELEKM